MNVPANHIQIGVVAAMLGAAVLVADDPSRPGLAGGLGVVLIAVGAGLAIGPVLSAAQRHRIVSISTVVGGLLLAAGLTYLAIGGIAMTAMLLIAVVATLAAVFAAPPARRS